MTDQDIIELLCHPRVRHMVRRIAKEEAGKALLSNSEPEAPRGMVSYKRAMELLGYSNQTIRAYRSQGLLKGGRGYVTIDSLMALAKKRGIDIAIPGAK